jgi:hypothetical protein
MAGVAKYSLEIKPAAGKGLDAVGVMKISR